MKKIIQGLVYLSILLGSLAYAQTQQLTGTFNAPDGTPVNGTMSIGLRGSSFKNICTTPYQVVPAKTTNFKVINGLIQNISSANFISQDCLSPRLPYTVEVADNTGMRLLTDSWYIPRVAGAVVNIGNMSPMLMGAGSPIQVAIPIGIVSTPSQSQTITQPVGTTLTINGNINLAGTVTFASTPAFAQIQATQVLVGGYTSSAYPLSVQGVINASTGYLVNGSAGTAGQCMLSNGSAFVIGNCPMPTIPTIYYQTVKLNNNASPQEFALDLDGPFTATDDATNSITHFALTMTGTGNYVVTSATNFGSSTNCMQGDGHGGITPTTYQCAGTPFGNNVIGSRSLGSVYQNTSGASMGAYVTGIIYGSYSQGFGISCSIAPPAGTLTFIANASVHNDQGQTTLRCPVPSGWYYQVYVDNTNVSNPQSPSIIAWWEASA